MAKDNRLPEDPVKRAYWLAYGSVINRALLKRKMTCAELSKKVEISPATVSRILTGCVQVNAFNHSRICGVFGWKQSEFEKALSQEKTRLATIEDLNLRYPAI
jgi:ribosome-binding protein aMBF1 (putative translation factor)